MKITFLLPLVNMSGGIRVVAIYAKKLAQRGHEVRLVSVPREATRRMHRIQQALSLFKAPKSHLDDGGFNHHVIDSFRPIVDADVPDGDIVIATWWETAQWLWNLSPSKGQKVYFVQGHEVYLESDAQASRATYRLPIKKIVVSKWLADIMATQYGDHDVRIVHNSVDHDQFRAPARGKQGRPTVGFLYSTAEVKGIDTVVKALGALRQRIPELRVVCFGSQKPNIDLDRIAEFSFDPPQQSIKDIYASCDVWLAASRSEGFNLTAMEAMACRTPVVSTRVGWPEEALKAGVNGSLVDVDDAQGLADRAYEILSLDEQAWRRMSDAAFATVRDSSWDRSTDLLEAALHEIRGQ
jgi:glycosyltransferase involved in cell wall biosynthesis